MSNSELLARQIGSVTIIDTGSIPLNSIEAIMAWQEQLTQFITTMKGKMLVINLNSIDYPPGPLMNVLAAIHQYAVEKKTRIALCEVGTENFKAFKMTRLNTIINIYNNEQDAIKAIKARLYKN